MTSDVAEPDVLTPIPLDASAISHHVRITYGLPLPAATIRKWAQRGQVDKVLGPVPSQNRYDLRSVLARLRAIGWIPDPDTP